MHAVAGERSQYRPLVSQFSPTPDPVALARGMRDRLGSDEIYVADLDAIVDRIEPAWGTFRALADLGLTVWADVGIKDGSQRIPWVEVGVGRVVVGLESVRGPAVLREIVDQIGPDRVVFSLDLRLGVPILAHDSDWPPDQVDEDSLVEQAVEAGVRSILRLDLATVGTGRGVADIPPVPEQWSMLEWITGGGVSGPGDLDRLAGRGYGAVLVGSALHDGRITADDLSGHRTS